MRRLQEWLVDVSGRRLQPDAEQVAMTRRVVRDLAGVVVAGQVTTVPRLLQAYLKRTAGSGPASIWGTPFKVDPVSAALANGTAAQALDYDDIAPSCVSHLNAIIVPSVAALSAQMAPGRVIEGYLRALTIVDAMASSFTHDVYDRGLQPTHTMGTLGAVCALLQALDAPPEMRANAFGLVATQAIGLRDHTGTRFKAMQAGAAAAAAVRSVLLALEGITAGTGAIDTMMRLIGLRESELIDLANREPTKPVPIATKAYPSCGASHTAIEATQIIRARFGARGGSPEARLAVASPARVLHALTFDRPSSPDEARFSMPYCVAVAWLRGEVKPADFREERIRSDEIARLMERVAVEADDSLKPPPTWAASPAIVRVELDRRQEQARVDVPLGYPERPLTDAAMEAKFLECVAPVLGEAQASEAARLLAGPEIFERLNDLLAVVPATA